MIGGGPAPFTNTRRAIYYEAEALGAPWRFWIAIRRGSRCFTCGLTSSQKNRHAITMHGTRQGKARLRS